MDWQSRGHRAGDGAPRHRCAPPPPVTQLTGGGRCRACPALPSLHLQLQICLDWMGQLLGLPDAFLHERSGGRGGGCIQSTARQAAWLHCRPCTPCPAPLPMQPGTQPSSLTVPITVPPLASDASLVAMLAAKARALEGRPPGDALRLVAYCSDQVGWR